MSAKQAINDKLQGSVATYFRCGAVVNNQIKKSLLLSLWVKFAHLANTLLKDEESARDNHVFACNFAKYLPIDKNSLSDSAINLC